MAAPLPPVIPEKTTNRVMLATSVMAAPWPPGKRSYEHHRRNPAAANKLQNRTRWPPGHGIRRAISLTPEALHFSNTRAHEQRLYLWAPRHEFAHKRVVPRRAESHNSRRRPAQDFFWVLFNPPPVAEANILPHPAVAGEGTEE